MLEGRVPPILPQLEIGLDENFLADVLHLCGIAGEAGRHAEDPAFVPSREFPVGIVIPRQRGFHQCLVGT